MNADVTRQLVAAAEPALAIVERAAIGSLLDGSLGGSVGVLARLDRLQVERLAAGLFEYLQPLACGWTVGREHGVVALVLFLVACHHIGRVSWNQASAFGVRASLDIGLSCVFVLMLVFVFVRAIVAGEFPIGFGFWVSGLACVSAGVAFVSRRRAASLVGLQASS